MGCTLTIQKVHCFCSIQRHVQVDMQLGVFKRFPREPIIAGAVLNQKNLNRFRIRSNRFHRFSFRSAEPIAYRAELRSLFCCFQRNYLIYRNR